TDSANPNHVVPNHDAADQLWAALAANQPLQLTGEAGVNDGVVVTEPTAPPVEPSTPPTTEATPGATTAPTEQPIALPSEISGSTAAQETCSNGNLR
ncbi:MAG TPA: LytR family transcriptional regulator, partial [Microbacterium sp.]|nr:LytR family transcriptional regulator [Microbacterium sp.]